MITGQSDHKGPILFYLSYLHLRRLQTAEPFAVRHTILEQYLPALAIFIHIPQAAFTYSTYLRSVGELT